MLTRKLSTRLGAQDIQPQLLACQWRIAHARDDLLTVRLALGAIVDLAVVAVDHLDQDGGARRDGNGRLEVLFIYGVRGGGIVIERVALLGRRYVDMPLGIVGLAVLAARLEPGMRRIGSL